MRAQHLAFVVRPTPTRPPAACFAFAGKMMWGITDRVELADRIGAWPWIGKTQSAILTLHHHKPQAGAARRPIRRFDQGRTSDATTKQAAGFFPFNAECCLLDRRFEIAREKAHGGSFPWIGGLGLYFSARIPSSTGFSTIRMEGNPGG